MKRWLELLLFGTGPLLALAASPMLARGLGPEGRGQLALATAVFALGYTIGNFGQAECLAADLRRESSAEAKSRYRIVGLASLCAGSAALYWLYANDLGFPASLAVAIAVPVSSVGLMWRARAVAENRVTLVATQAAIPAALRLLVIVALFALNALTTFNAITVSMVTTSLGVVFLWVILHKPTSSREPAPKLKSASLPVRTIRSSLAQGVPVLGFALCTSVVLRADLFFLNGLSTPAQVGFYAVAVAVTESALALSAAFKNRMQAAIYTPDPRRNVKRESAVMLISAAPAVLVGELTAAPFTRLMFGDEFTPAIPTLRVLILAAVCLMLVDCAQGVLAVLGQRTAMFASSAIGALITVALLWLLIPALGALGAAIASLCSYAAIAAMAWAQTYRTLKTLN